MRTPLIATLALYMAAAVPARAEGPAYTTESATVLPSSNTG